MNDYRLVPTLPDLMSYRRLRSDAGLTPVTAEQAGPALRNAWAGCHIIHEDSGDVVAMGRIIGDGGWYFHIVDMATAPDHQRRGLGDRVLTWLLDTILEAAPADPYITLMADPPLIGHSRIRRGVDCTTSTVSPPRPVSDWFTRPGCSVRSTTPEVHVIRGY